MQMALVLFNKLLSLFIIMLLGYAMVRIGLLSASESRSLSMLSLYIVCPVAVMNAFQVEPTPEILNGMLLAFCFAVLTHIIFIFGTRLLRRPLHLEPIERGSICYPNSGILAIPLINAMLGPEWVIYTCAYNAVQIFLQWTHLRTMISGENKLELKKIVLNPNMIAITLGIVIFFTGFRFPGPLGAAVESVALMIGPVGMLVTGMVIGGMSLKKVFSARRGWFIVALRLVAFPLVMVLIARLGNIAALVPDGDKIIMISLIGLSGPCGTTVMQMAQIYTDHETAEYASAMNIISMLCCALTMPLIVAIYFL